MPKQKVPFEALKNYLPDNSFSKVVDFINANKVQLTVTRSRASVLGDYRHAGHGERHRISVNGDLNKYAFLITLLHEMAHLITFGKYKNHVRPHGREWKTNFASLLKEFLRENIFPADVRSALLRSIENPAASSCADDHLLRVLKNYDAGAEGISLLEALPPGQNFLIRGGRIFSKGEQLRKRFKCIELVTGKTYLFSPLYEVKPLP